MPASASDSAETVAGSAFGTPAFMSPEQAAGRLDLLGPASDVYSLGATLYCVLTGRAPFEEKDAGQVLKQVEQGEFPRPRQVKPEVPAPLEAVCLKAMSLDPAGRYSSCRELAEEIERWLADEPVAALQEPIAVRARRWMRKHRPLVTGMAAALIVGVVSLGAAALVLSAKNTELENANTTISAKNTELEQANTTIGRTNEDLKKSFASETAAREDAQKNEKLAAEQRTLALQTLRLVVGDIDVQLKNKPTLQELRQKLLDKALEGLKKVARSADNSGAIDHNTLRTHFELGALFLTLEGAGVDQAHKQYQQAHAIAVQRAAADPRDSEAQRDLYISFYNLGDVSRQLGQLQAAKDYYKDGLDILKKRAVANPTDTQAQRDLVVSSDKLGEVSQKLGQVQAAKDYYQDCLGISKKRADDDPTDSQAQRDLSLSFMRLGDLSLQLGQAQEAKDYYKDGLDILKKRAATDPTDSEAQRDLSVSFERLGDVSLQLRQVQAAKDYYKGGLDIRKKRADDDPKNSQAQRDLSVSLQTLGDVSLQLGQLQAATEYYKDGLDISKKLAAADPKDNRAQRSLSLSLNKLGDVSLQLGQVQAAKEYYKDGLDIRKKRAAADPRDFEAQTDLVISHFKLGTVAAEIPDHRQARQSYAEALAVLEPLQKAGLLKGTRYAGWPIIFNDKIAACRRVEETLADINAAFKHPPEATRELLLMRAKELARMKKLDDAAATAGRLAILKDALGEALFAAARAHGYTAAVAGAMPDQHAEQALKLLRQARGRGCFDLPANRKLLETHRDFEPLRKLADFAKLQAEIAADTGRLVLEKKGELRPTDPPDTQLKKSPCQVHEIALTAGKRYAFALDRALGPAPSPAGEARGVFDPFLRLEDASGKELTRDDDSGGDLNAFLVYIATQTGTYRIIVTSFDGTGGAYVLTVRERQ